MTNTAPQFDVFLAHNSLDKPQVRVIAQELKQRGLKPWLDEEQIPPGRSFQDEIQQAIPLVKSAAILVGSLGLGAWQAWELRTLISQCVKNKIPVIPVLLPGVSNVPDHLLFLQEFRWVSFSQQVNDVATLDLLEWGITGNKPNSKPKPTPVYSGEDIKLIQGEKSFIQRFKNTHDYAVSNGFVGGFPNFRQFQVRDRTRIYTQCEIILLNSVAAECRNVMASELGYPPDGDIGSLFRASSDYAFHNGFAAGFPNFYQAYNGQEIVYEIILVNSSSLEWRDVPKIELGNLNNEAYIERFIAIHEYAIRNGFVGGFPNFHQADYGSGVVYGTYLLIRNGAELRNVDSGSLE